MATKDTKMVSIDSCDLDVEELEERLELAALFATKASATSGEIVVATAYQDQSCWAHWHDGCNF